MMYTRYARGCELAGGRRVLEIACGAGQGLGLIATSARQLVGGDYSLSLLRMGKQHYRAQIPLVQLSAEALPFSCGSFDLVLFFEASYYVPNMHAAFDEVARVLANRGTVAFVNANPERTGFIRSPHSIHYHTAQEFRDALESRGFEVTVEGAFPADAPASGLARAKHAAIALARWALEATHLVPRTLKGRARLKRLVYGRQRAVPAHLPKGFAAIAPRTAVTEAPVRNYKVLYVTAIRAS